MVTRRSVSRKRRSVKPFSSYWCPSCQFPVEVYYGAIRNHKGYYRPDCSCSDRPHGGFCCSSGRTPAEFNALWQEAGNKALQLRTPDNWRGALADYHAYLQSQSWLEKREEIARRSSGFCELCRHRRVSDIHHLTYRRIFFELKDDLMALCRQCHEKEHGLAAPVRLC